MATVRTCIIAVVTVNEHIGRYTNQTVNHPKKIKPVVLAPISNSVVMIMSISNQFLEFRIASVE